jgi:hypothetical protein
MPMLNPPRRMHGKEFRARRAKRTDQRTRQVFSLEIDAKKHGGSDHAILFCALDVFHSR